MVSQQAPGVLCLNISRRREKRTRQFRPHGENDGGDETLQPPGTGTVTRNQGCPSPHSHTHTHTHTLVHTQNPEQLRKREATSRQPQG